MNDRNQDNLKELLTKFYDAEQIESCAEDFRKAEQILHEHPAPEPDPMLIANIKAEIAMRLGSRKVRRLRRFLYEAAGIAAAIVFLTFISLQHIQKPDIPSGKGVYAASLIPEAIWESDDITVDDTDLAVFTTEIDQIESEIQTLQSGEDISENENTITELEMELAEINNDFWKG